MDLNMKTTHDRAAQLLQLSDEEYYSLTDEQVFNLQDSLDAIMQGDGPDDPDTPPVMPPPLVAIGAPTQARLKQDEPVPVLFAAFETGLRAWQVNFDSNLLFLVKNHATGRLIFSTPFISYRRGQQPLLSGAGTPPDEVNATSTTALVTTIDLLDKMAGQLTPGILSVTAVAYDVRSNTVEIELLGDGRPDSPELQTSAFVRHELDSTRRIDTELKVPVSGSARHGIRLRVATQTKGRKGIVRTADDVPFLPCHLVLVRLDEYPSIIPASVPAQKAETASSEEPAYNALFTVLLGGDGHPISPGKYQVYFDLGPDLLGPLPLTVSE